MKWMLILVLALAGLTCAAEAQAQDWTDDEFALARLVASEAGLYNPRRPDDRDVLAIAQIVKRVARWRRMTVAEYIASAHTRHTDPNRWNNRWVLGLNREGTQPPQWRPAIDGRWEGEDQWAYKQRWFKRLAQAREGLEGDPVCVHPPITWGGPVVDRERIARMTASGLYVVVDCGPTRNVFLARRRDVPEIGQ